jgi:hypothetical protein
MLVKNYISLILILSTTPVFCQCTVLNGSNTGEESAEVHAKKAEYARSIISDTNYLHQQPTCVTAAMKYLGTAKDASAIPQLVNLLGYKVPTPQCEGPNAISRA